MDWLDWIYSPPPKDALIILKTPSGITILRPRDLPPEFNVGNAEWKLTGIGREELGWEWEPTQLGFQQMEMGAMGAMGILSSLFGPTADGLGASELDPDQYNAWFPIQ
jgi:hypothetical protein